MITTTVMNLLATKPILSKLAEKEMPIQDSLKVLRILKKTEEEFKVIDEAQQKLLLTYGEKDENGKLIPDGKNGVKIAAANADEFSAEFNALLQSQISFECDKLAYSVLNNLQISPLQLLNMEDFLEDE